MLICNQINLYSENKNTKRYMTVVRGGERYIFSIIRDMKRVEDTHPSS